MLAAVTLSSSPTRSGTDAMTSRTTSPMASNEMAARTQPRNPMRTRSRKEVIGASSRLRSSHQAASEIAASQITEPSEVAERATIAKFGIPGREVATLGVKFVGRGVGSLGRPRVVFGIPEERIGDHATDHDAGDRTHEVAHHETAHARPCRHTGPGPLQRTRLAHLGSGGEPGERTRILVIGRTGRALGRR